MLNSLKGIAAGGGGVVWARGARAGGYGLRGRGVSAGDAVLRGEGGWSGPRQRGAFASPPGKLLQCAAWAVLVARWGGAEGSLPSAPGDAAPSC